MKILPINYYIPTFQSQKTKFAQHFNFAPLMQDTISFSGRHPIPVYAKKIRSNEPPIKYDDIKEAAEKTGTSVNYVRQTIYGCVPHAKGYSFKYASEIEDENGNIDEKKMEEFVDSAKSCKITGGGKRPVYAKKIKSDEPPIRFDSVSQAARELGIKSACCIPLCLTGKKGQAQGYIFKYAFEIEDEKCNVDDKKLQEFSQYVKNYSVAQAVYAKKIKSDEAPIKFQSAIEAAEKLNLENANTIYSCLCGSCKQTQGYVFKYASEIEDENGDVDEKKMEEFVDSAIAFKKYSGVYVPIYTKKIKSDEPPIRFDSIREATEELNFKDHSVISACLSGRSKQSLGYTFKYASEIEDENGDVDEKKMEEFILDAKNYKIVVNNKPVYAKKAGSDEPFKKYASEKEAKEELGIKHSAYISRCLSGKLKQAGGYVFIRASEFEDENKEM